MLAQIRPNDVQAEIQLVVQRGELHKQRGIMERIFGKHAAIVFKQGKLRGKPG